MSEYLYDSALGQFTIQRRMRLKTNCVGKFEVTSKIQIKSMFEVLYKIELLVQKKDKSLSRNGNTSNSRKK